ncbi:ABC transporter ATP-binding protein [Cytophagaceae bacterium ABcell3]|nr:ABC transporter ATP-binding protein [Cytophagaceae bacterium ABcell3]
MNILQINTLSKKYSSKGPWALKNINLEVEKGELLALIGESGSGKSTLLRLIAGFEDPDDGEIFINDQCVAGKRNFISPEKRQVGMVFQDYALFPHMDIAENVGFGIKQLSGKEKKERVGKCLSLVGLSGYEKRYPHQLSGGQQQRIALARAMAPNPGLILLDEPFSNLDGVLKDQVREEIRNIIKTSGTTAIFVTHDTKDALSTADRIAILKDGEIQQIGYPEEVYNTPANTYVANFFGKTNLLNATPEDGGLKTPVGFIPCPCHTPGKVIMAIRPENIDVCSYSESPYRGRIKSVTYLGDQKQIIIEVEHPKETCCLMVRVPADTAIQVNEKIGFNIKEEKINILQDQNRLAD